MELAADDVVNQVLVILMIKLIWDIMALVVAGGIAMRALGTMAVAVAAEAMELRVGEALITPTLMAVMPVLFMAQQIFQLHTLVLAVEAVVEITMVQLGTAAQAEEVEASLCSQLAIV